MFLLFTSGEMYSRYKRQRILHFARECMGYMPPTICRMLREEGLIVNRMEVHKLLQKHRVTNNMHREKTRFRPTNEDDGACESTRSAADEGRR